MVRELDTVVLTHDIEEHDLKQGDIGAVVHCYADRAAFEVGVFSHPFKVFESLCHCLPQKVDGDLAGLSPKISLLPCRLQDPNNQLFICMKSKGQ